MRFLSAFALLLLSVCSVFGQNKLLLTLEKETLTYKFLNKDGAEFEATNIKDFAALAISNKNDSSTHLIITFPGETPLGVINITAPAGDTIIAINDDKIKVGESDYTMRLPFNAKAALPGGSKDINVPTKKSGDQVVTVKPGDFLFIPNSAQEKAFRALASAGEQTNMVDDLSTDYEIIYNFANQKLLYYRVKGGKLESKPRARVSPAVGKNIQVRVMNYNPYRDSLQLVTSFASRNTESGAQFMGLITGAIGATQEGETDEEVTGEEAIAHSTKEKCAYIAQLKMELKIFYEKMINSRYIDIKILEASVDHIHTQIKEKFELPSPSPALLAEAGKACVEIETGDNKEKMEKDLAEAVALYTRIISYNLINFAPLQIKNEDETKLTFEIYRYGKKIATPEYTYLNRQGWKLDFSAGLAASGLIDKNYTTMQTAGDQDSIIFDNQGNASIGPSLFAHFYPRTGRRINVAVMLGLTVDNNIATRYLVGGSLLLGHEQRWIISAGTALGKVKRLASGLKEGEIYQFTEGQSRVIPLKDEFKNSYFVSLSFNIGSVNLGK